MNSFEPPCPYQIHIEALIPKTIVFRDGAYRETIKVKWDTNPMELVLKRRGRVTRDLSLSLRVHRGKMWEHSKRVAFFKPGKEVSLTPILTETWTCKIHFCCSIHPVCHFFLWLCQQTSTPPFWFFCQILFSWRVRDEVFINSVLSLLLFWNLLWKYFLSWIF